MNHYDITSAFAGLVRSVRSAVVAGAAVLLLGSIAQAQPRYTVTDLGSLAGYSDSVARGLNDRGDVVGSCSSANTSFGETGFVWRAGKMTDTGRLPKGNYSVATAINLAGTVVGDGDTGNFRPQAWVATAKGLVNFFPNNGGNTHAIAINNSGVICGYYTKSLSGNTSSWRGALWMPDPKDPRKFTTIDLPSIPGINPAGANAIPWTFNNLGQAAGWVANDVIGQHGAFWNNDDAHSIVDLGTLPGDWSSLAWGMNDLGQVVGESHSPAGDRAVLWQNDAAHTPVALPALAGDVNSTASAINNLGQILGRSTAADGSYSIVIWIDGVAYDLETLIDSASNPGWVLITVAGINNAGQIACTGFRNGVSHAFLLTPIAQ
ncbi:MAG: hypothetical protein QM715_00540 [Nibricoccus sp.]